MSRRRGRAPSAEALLGDYARLAAIARGSWLARPGSKKRAAASGLQRVRDLIILPLIGDLRMVIASDSNASIGEKPADAIRIPYSEVGISAIKVALMEVVAAGAVPLVVVNALCVEMEPSGRRLIDVMREELSRSGFDPDLMLTGSTEDNALTTQSGIGVTVVGIGHQRALRIGQSRSGDAVFCVGIPKGGPTTRYSERDPDIATIRTVLKLRRLAGVREILPVGSHGVLHEAQQLALEAGVGFEPIEPAPAIDLRGSAGAATAVLCSAGRRSAASIQRAARIPVHRIGLLA